jgi:hypothetical protein
MAAWRVEKKMSTVAQLSVDPSSPDVSHEEHIELVAGGASVSFQPEGIDDSWRRCLLLVDGTAYTASDRVQGRTQLGGNRGSLPSKD